MGRVEATEEVEATVQGEPVASYPPQNDQTRQPPFIGIPWSSGLFDCHLDQTNGDLFILNVFFNPCSNLSYAFSFLNRVRLLFFSAAMTALLPCVTFGQLAEVVDAGEFSKSSVELIIYT